MTDTIFAWPAISRQVDARHRVRFAGDELVFDRARLLHREILVERQAAMREWCLAYAERTLGVAEGASARLLRVGTVGHTAHEAASRGMERHGLARFDDTFSARPLAYNREPYV